MIPKEFLQYVGKIQPNQSNGRDLDMIDQEDFKKQVGEILENDTEHQEGLVGFSDSVMDIPQETVDAFDGDELRARVFYEKYALRDLSGKIIEKTPEELWSRIAREISSPEKTSRLKEEWEKKFFWLLSDFKFIPGGRILLVLDKKGGQHFLTVIICQLKKIQLKVFLIGARKRQEPIPSVVEWERTSPS